MVLVPLRRIRIPGTSEVGGKAFLSVQVHTRRGWVPLELIVDTGSSVTTIAVSFALDRGLVGPQRVLQVNVGTAVGRFRQRRRPGYITIRIPGLEPREFIWPCHFLEHEGVAPKPALGLAGVLHDLRLIFDGSYRADAPYGSLVIEPLSGHRR